MKTKLSLICLGVGILSGCSASIKHSDHAPTWYTVEAHEVKRVAMYTTRLNDNLTDLYNAQARAFISHRKDFLLIGPKKMRVWTLEEYPALCKANEDAQAVLVNEVETFRDQKEQIGLRVRGTLVNCDPKKFGQILWQSTVEDCYDKEDEDLKVLVAAYTARFGEPAKPYIPAFYGLSAELYQSMPDPFLTGEEVDEKVELDAEYVQGKREPLSVAHLNSQERKK